MLAGETFMKKFAVLAGVVVAGLVLAQGSSPLSGFVKAMNDANSLSATFTYQKIGGTSTTYSISMAKPNMVRIDKPGEMIVADGKTIVTYDKKSKSYFKLPQTDAEIGRLFNDDEFSLFAPFFEPKAFDKLAKVTPAGTKNRKGITFDVVEATVDAKGFKKATFYIDPANKIARQLEITFSDGPEVVRTLVDVKEVTVGGDANASLFAFKAPEGAKEVSLEEMSADKWYHNLDEAKEVAKRTNRKIFIDFYATWCGPCKLLAAEVFPTADFKKLSKNLVFCKIDVDQDKATSQAYKITAMPTQMVVNADGSVVVTKVGYGGVADFFNTFGKFAN